MVTIVIGGLKVQLWSREEYKETVRGSGTVNEQNDELNIWFLPHLSPPIKFVNLIKILQMAGKQIKLDIWFSGDCVVSKGQKTIRFCLQKCYFVFQSWKYNYFINQRCLLMSCPDKGHIMGSTWVLEWEDLNSSSAFIICVILVEKFV